MSEAITPKKGKYRIKDRSSSSGHFGGQVSIIIVSSLDFRSDSPFQEVLKKLRNPLNVNEFYTEVQERCKDLDEFIAKKQKFWYLYIHNFTIEFGYRFHGRQIFY